MSSYYKQIKLLSDPTPFFTLLEPLIPFYKGKNKSSEI